jgi:hypothetical protein
MVIITISATEYNLMNITTNCLSLISPMFNGSDEYMKANEYAFVSKHYMSTTGTASALGSYEVDLKEGKFIFHLSLELEVKLHQQLDNKVVRIKNLKEVGFRIQCAYEHNIPKNFLGFEDGVYTEYDQNSILPRTIAEILNAVRYELESKAKLMLLHKIIDTKTFEVFDINQTRIRDLIMINQYELSQALKYDEFEYLEYTNYLHPKRPPITILHGIQIKEQDDKTQEALNAMRSNESLFDFNYLLPFSIEQIISNFQQSAAWQINGNAEEVFISQDQEIFFKTTNLPAEMIIDAFAKQFGLTMDVVIKADDLSLLCTKNYKNGELIGVSKFDYKNDDSVNPIILEYVNDDLIAYYDWLENKNEKVLS